MLLFRLAKRNPPRHGAVSSKKLKRDSHKFSRPVGVLLSHDYLRSRSGCSAAPRLGSFPEHHPATAQRQQPRANRRNERVRSRSFAAASSLPTDHAMRAIAPGTGSAVVSACPSRGGWRVELVAALAAAGLTWLVAAGRLRAGCRPGATPARRAVARRACLVAVPVLSRLTHPGPRRALRRVPHRCTLLTGRLLRMESAASSVVYGPAGFRPIPGLVAH